MHLHHRHDEIELPQQEFTDGLQLRSGRDCLEHRRAELRFWWSLARLKRPLLAIVFDEEPAASEWLSRAEILRAKCCQSDLS